MHHDPNHTNSIPEYASSVMDEVSCLNTAIGARTIVPAHTSQIADARVTDASVLRTIAATVAFAKNSSQQSRHPPKTHEGQRDGEPRKLTRR